MQETPPFLDCFFQFGNRPVKKSPPEFFTAFLLVCEKQKLNSQGHFFKLIDNKNRTGYNIIRAI